MLPGERRFQRDHFTAKLQKLCARLDERPGCTVSFTDFLRRPVTTHVEILQLWVAGSYSRGALECGDLDLVARLKPNRNNPGASTVSRALLGAMAHVHCYLGDLETNTSGVAFPEAILVWDGPGCGWAKVIAAIRPNPAAGRSARSTDGMPFRLEQLDGNIEDYEELLELKNSGILDWEFVPATAEALRSVVEHDISVRDQPLFNWSRDWGQKSKRLLPFLTRILKETDPFGDWRLSSLRTRDLQCGGSLIRIGRPLITGDLLGGDVGLSQVIAIPHISARGPNGAWILRRGPQHPDSALIASRGAMLCTADGSPAFFQALGINDAYGGGARVIDLFSTIEAGRDWIKAWGHLDDEPELVPYRVQTFHAHELLVLLSGCDAITIDDEAIALNPRGEEFADQRCITSIRQIFARLPTAEHLDFGKNAGA